MSTEVSSSVRGLDKADRVWADLSAFGSLGKTMLNFHLEISASVLGDLLLLLTDFPLHALSSPHQDFGQGAVAILHAGLIPLLISKLKTEPDGIQALILDTLSNCLPVEASEALAAGAVPILKEKLTHSLVTIRIKAALVLLEIGTHAEGKAMVCEEVVPVLVGLLDDADPDVQASATGALMFAIIKPQGRFSALGAGAIPSLLKLVAEETSKARLSAIKALTMLAELPQGRRTLLEHTATFQRCLGASREAVKRAARTAISVIEWKPC